MKNLFNLFKKKKFTPPVPSWQPNIPQSIEVIIERMKYYTDNQKDLAIFKNGTCVILKDNLSDQQVLQYANEVLSQIYNYHPDMNPVNMDDGNILVQYNHPAANVVLSAHTEKHWEVINKNHLKALATNEVLITHQGHNIFDDNGKKALFGRCFMFMDAQSPEVIRIVRK